MTPNASVCRKISNYFSNPTKHQSSHPLMQMNLHPQRYRIFHRVSKRCTKDWLDWVRSTKTTPMPEGSPCPPETTRTTSPMPSIISISSAITEKRRSTFVPTGSGSSERMKAPVSEILLTYSAIKSAMLENSLFTVSLTFL